jgi:hypothetical protein
MAMNDTSSNAASTSAAAASGVAKPLNQLTRKQRQEVTSELLRIHSLLNNQTDREDHKDAGSNKAEGLGFDKKS